MGIVGAVGVLRARLIRLGPRFAGKPRTLLRKPYVCLPHFYASDTEPGKALLLHKMRYLKKTNYNVYNNDDINFGGANG